ncbi:hypothetical protein [Nocardioides sp. YIM 152315]|uniref:hypothetical protein n=1 Tax=Nocardioides sp. YIM 152315 TaxID=3031760 RepID=UPI0023D9C40F|nr:hypothetical protein [Nocardioides sp. YIM 152315]MDF1606247.1 hypothetical protein [Nocardioides sp. YIM 152315]
MRAITWEPSQHRLRLAGRCGGDDLATVEEALAAVAGRRPVLILDLTAVVSLAPSVAEAIVAACDRSDGCRVSVLRRHGGDVDRVLRELGV